ncbi:MAG: 4-hydroxy-3-methylbut-2-enyl diphosphate reductase [Lachnospiraceae bacterium]|nr:4-hydroxy-3-methylbut-2-enyl diphosphate reductase [Lachnospiraceae bacterium]
MKDVRLAKSAGFCFGVKRAVNTVYKEAQKGIVYTYGPIIHNEEVVKDLEKRGVKVVEDLETFQDLPKGTVIIRSHGVAKDVYDFLENKGFKIVDATCPYVLKIHRIVKEHSKRGEHILIIGNDKHPEVEGIKGWCFGNATVVQTKEKAKEFTLSGNQRICIVSQTTFNYKKFQELVEIIQKKGYDIIVLNTICNATEERQTEARAIAKNVDAMIVIGGKSSSNTQKLFEICKMECENTYYIQTLGDLDLTKLESVDNVGITAGASTPNNIIEEVQKKVRNEL